MSTLKHILTLFKQILEKILQNLRSFYLQNDVTRRTRIKSLSVGMRSLLYVMGYNYIKPNQDVQSCSLQCMVLIDCHWLQKQDDA